MVKVPTIKMWEATYLVFSHSKVATGEENKEAIENDFYLC